MNTKLIIFDMDGTLFRTETVDIVAINRALCDNGFNSRSDEEILSLIGLTLDESGKLLLGCDYENLKNKFFEDVIKYEIEEISKRGKLYIGVEETLRALADGGFTLCICSNGNAVYINKIIDEFSLEKYFKDIWTYTPGISKFQAIGILKNRYDVETFVVVGDRMQDISGAKDNMGISIGVSYGFGKEEVLCADYCCHSLKEVAECINKIYEKNGETLCVE